MTDLDKTILIGKVLMPEATLEGVAAAYGISRARVGQIFESSTGRKYSEIKQALIDERFRCLKCGNPIPLSRVSGKERRKRNYCSDECAKFAAMIDMAELAQCQYSKCKNFYFVNRNWKFTKKKEFCCLDHYLAHFNEKNKGGKDADHSGT